MADEDKKIKLVIEVKDDLSGFNSFNKEAKKQKKVTEDLTKDFVKLGKEAKTAADTTKKSFSGIGASVKKSFDKISANAKKAFKNVVKSVKTAANAIKNKLSKPLIRLKNELVSLGNKAKWAFALIVATTSLIGKSTIEAASEAEEAGSKFEAVFTSSSGSAEEAVKRIQSLGVGYYQVKQDLGDLGALMKGFGFSSVEATKQSEKALKLAYDLASYHNLTFSEAITKIRSGMTGETEPLKQIGILVLDQNMKNYAESLGIVWEKANQLEKAQLRLNYSFEQAEKQGAIGDLARTSENFANQLRKAQGKVMEIKVAIGEQLLPVTTKLIKAFNSFDIVKFIKSEDFKRITKLTVSFISLLGAVAAVGIAIQLLSNPLVQTTAAIAGAVVLWKSDFLGIETILTGIKDLVFDAWKGLMKIINIPKANALKGLDEDIIKINEALKDGTIDSGEYYNLFGDDFRNRLKKLVKKGLIELPDSLDNIPIDFSGNFSFDEKKVTDFFKDVVVNYKDAKGELSEASITEILFGKGNIIDKNVNEVKAGAKEVIEDQKDKIKKAINELQKQGLIFGENFGDGLLKQLDLMLNKLLKVDEAIAKGSSMPNVYGLDVGDATSQAVKARKTFLKSDKYNYSGVGGTEKGYDKQYKKFYKNLAEDVNKEDKLRKKQIKNLSSIGSSLSDIGDMFGSDLISILGQGVTGVSSIMSDFDAFTAPGAGVLDKFASGLGMLTTAFQVGSMVYETLFGGPSQREVAEQNFSEAVEDFGEYVDNLNLGESFNLLSSLSKNVALEEISDLFSKKQVTGTLSDSAATQYKYLTETADLKSISDLLNLKGLEFTQDEIKDLLDKNKYYKSEVQGASIDYDEEGIIRDINEIIANTNTQLTENLKEGLGLTAGDFTSTMISSFEDRSFKESLSDQVAEAFKSGVYQSTEYQDVYNKLGNEISKQVTNAVSGTDIDLTAAKDLIVEIDNLGNKTADALDKINNELGLTTTIINDLFASALVQSDTFEDFTKNFGESLYQDGMDAMEELFKDAGLQKQILDVMFDEVAFKKEMETIKIDSGMTDDEKINAYWKLKQEYENTMNEVLRSQGYDRSSIDVTAGTNTSIGYANTGTSSGTINYIENKLVLQGAVYGAGGEDALFEKFQDFVDEKDGDEG